MESLKSSKSSIVPDSMGLRGVAFLLARDLGHDTLMTPGVVKLFEVIKNIFFLALVAFCPGRAEMDAQLYPTTPPPPMWQLLGEVDPTI